MPVSASPQASRPPSGRPVSSARVATASFIGTTVEFYDFFIYGTAAALVFPQLFFPDSDPFVGTLLAFATFGVGFLARPLGGIVFGHFGDRVGRKTMLIVSLLMMGTATVLIGLLPTYAAVGVAAPLMLTALRLVQGLAVGGEWGGAVLMAVEHARPGRRGFFGSFPQAGAPAGTLLATITFLAFSFLPEEDFLAWGWRVPFLLSAVLILVGFFIRMRITESPEFQAVREEKTVEKLPLVEAFRRHPRQIMQVAGAFLAQSAFAYIYISYMTSYGTNEVGYGRPEILTVICLSGAVGAGMHLVFGALSDRWGRKRVYLTGVAALVVTVFPSFALIDSGDVVLAGLGHVLVFGLAIPLSGGPTAALFSEMFDADVRYTGASVGYQLAGILGAATSPMIATSLLEFTGTSASIAGYLCALAVVSLVATWTIRDPQQRVTGSVTART